MSDLQNSIQYLENIMDGFQREICQEYVLINEKTFILDRSHQVSTGFSLARGVYPVVKIACSKKKIAIQFSTFEWELFWNTQKECIYSHISNKKKEDVNTQNERSEYLLSSYIKVIYDCIKQGKRSVRVIHIESRGVTITLTAKAMMKLGEIEKYLIKTRLQRLQISGFNQYYMEVLNSIVTHKPDNETIEDFLKKIWMHDSSGIWPSEYQECIFEILVLCPEYIKKDVGILKSQS